MRTVREEIVMTDTDYDTDLNRRFDTTLFLAPLIGFSITLLILLIGYFVWYRPLEKPVTIVQRPIIEQLAPPSMIPIPSPGRG